MRKIEVSEASGAALDWLVAKCEGFQLPDMPHSLYDWFKAHGPRYSADWSQGGPIIHREGICIKSEARDHSLWSAQLAYCRQVLRWPQAELVWTYCLHRGPTPLIAAMRCYVASKLGNTVEVPESLMNT